jgi:hypothetical protein
MDALGWPLASELSPAAAGAYGAGGTPALMRLPQLGLGVSPPPRGAFLRTFSTPGGAAAADWWAAPHSALLRTTGAWTPGAQQAGGARGGGPIRPRATFLRSARAPMDAAAAEAASAEAHWGGWSSAATQARARRAFPESRPLSSAIRPAG